MLNRLLIKYLPRLQLSNQINDLILHISVLLGCLNKSIHKIFAFLLSLKGLGVDCPAHGRAGCCVEFKKGTKVTLTTITVNPFATLLSSGYKAVKYDLEGLQYMLGLQYPYNNKTQIPNLAYWGRRYKVNMNSLDNYFQYISVTLEGIANINLRSILVWNDLFILANGKLRRVDKLNIR